jgi:arginyl-tRNA synthetase
MDMESKVAKDTFNHRVFTVKSFSNDVSIKSQFQRQLWQAIDRINTLPIAAQLTPKTVPLHRVSTYNYVCYRSAIALKLSSAWQQTPLDIAHQLTAALLTLSQESADAIGINFTVEVLPPGWIIFRLSDRALAIYLQWCFKITPFPSVPENYLNEKLQKKGGAGDREKQQQNQLNSDKIFPVQYIHARCCSLLRLADEQGLIQVLITIIFPNPIPWVEVARESDRESVHLRLTHPAEWELIVQLLDLLDVMSASDCQRWVKQGLAVSEAYEQFDKSCRIWGEVKIHDLPLAQARLGLIGVTQVVLRSLLEKLGVSAPRAL